jgi:hypothetical protein
MGTSGNEIDRAEKFKGVRVKASIHSVRLSGVFQRWKRSRFFSQVTSTTIFDLHRTYLSNHVSLTGSRPSKTSNGIVVKPPLIHSSSDIRPSESQSSSTNISCKIYQHMVTIVKRYRTLEGERFINKNLVDLVHNSIFSGNY